MAKLNVKKLTNVKIFIFIFIVVLIKEELNKIIAHARQVQSDV